MSQWSGVAVQWLKRVNAGDAGRHNSSVTYSHDGDVYALLPAAARSRDASRTSVSTTRRRGGGDAAAATTYVSQLSVSRVTRVDAGLYVCVATGRYGVRSYRAAALHVLASDGQ